MMLSFEIIDIHSLDSDARRQALELMEPEKAARILRLAHDEDRARSIAADHLARRMIAERFDIPLCEVRLSALPGGKPIVVGLPCHISLSHSGSSAMCTLSDKPVGADIEQVSRRGERHVSRVCSPGEREYVMPGGRFVPERFLEVWTAKEALLKLTGEGLSGGLAGTVVADACGLLERVGNVRIKHGRSDDAVYCIAFEDEE